MKRLYVNAKVVCRDTVRETAVLTEDAKILADEMRSKGYESYWTYTFGGNNEF